MHLVLGWPNEPSSRYIHKIRRKNVFFYTFLEKSPVKLSEKNI